MNKGFHLLISLRRIRFIGWTLNQLFNSDSMRLKEQDVILKVNDLLTQSSLRATCE